MVGEATLRIQERVRKDVKLGELVRQKMAQFDTDQLEEIVVGSLQTELRAIEVLGGVLGFLIGLFQALLLTVVLVWSPPTQGSLTASCSGRYNLRYQLSQPRFKTR